MNNCQDEKMFEALLTIKECCEKNYCPNGSCICPCFVDEDCVLMNTDCPKDWNLKKRLVFF